LDTEDEVK